MSGLKKPLVSIVTPSFNGAKFLDNYFEKILGQTYKNVELILVNNGSTDNTDEIVEKYKNKIMDRGFRFKYLQVEKNTGPLKGLNLGIKNIEGEYFSEIDVDDSMHYDYIEKKVDFFLTHPDIDILITPVHIFDYKNKSTVIAKSWKSQFVSKDDLIDKYLLGGEDVGYMGGAYMMRSSTFFNTYSNHEIIDDDRIWGFATILYFPQIYLYKAAYLNEVLFDYYIHGNNLHIKSEKRNLDILPTTYQLVMEKMHLNETEKVKILKKVNIYVQREYLGIAYKEYDKNEVRKAYKELKENDGIRFKDLVKNLLISNRFIYKCFNKLWYKG